MSEGQNACSVANDFSVTSLYPMIRVTEPIISSGKCLERSCTLQEDQKSFCFHRLRPLVVIKQNTGQRHLCVVFIFQSQKLRASVLAVDVQRVLEILFTASYKGNCLRTELELIKTTVLMKYNITQTKHKHSNIKAVLSIYYKKYSISII